MIKTGIKENRIVSVPINPEDIAELFISREAHWQFESDLPKGTEYVCTVLDPGSSYFEIFYEHESFDIVPVNGIVPKFNGECKISKMGS